ncbi:MAG: hypothetical protein WA006_10435 [Rhodoglobus sp.]
MIARLLPPAILGVFVGGVLGSFFTGGDWIYTIVWSCAIPAFILSGLLLSGRRLAGRTGGIAIARVESVQRSGASTPVDQELELRLVVLPERGKAFTTSTRLRVTTEELRDYVAGAVLVVQRLAGDRPDVTVVRAPAPEAQALAERARLDPSIIPVSSAAPAWETATTTQPGTARPVTGGRRFGLAVSLVITAVVAALVLLPAWGSIGRAFTDLVTWDLDGGNMVTGDYQQLAIDQIAAVAGGYDFTSANFYPDYVIVGGLTSPGASTTDSYQWRYGRAFRDGPELIQPSDLAAELFDASELDFSVIGEVVQDALGRSRLDGIDSVYAFVHRDGAEGLPVIMVSISAAYGNVNLTYGFDGRLIRES